jgi:hypothetical protein
MPVKKLRTMGVTCIIAVSLMISCSEQEPRQMSLKSDITVNGEPIMGAYAVQGIEGLRIAKETGMNVVLGGHKFLDTTTVEGKFCFENNIKVMHHLTGQVYGRPRLRNAITATQTTIQLRKDDRHPPSESGIVQIEEELIQYGSWNDSALVDCERGYDGTVASTHREVIILFWPEECAEEIEHVKDSPNLWGYYTLDDSPGDALSALRGIYSTVQRLDPDRTVIAGYGSGGSLVNFDTGVCDVMLFYWYPVSNNGYDSSFTTQQTQWLLSDARRRVPGIPFIGIYQSFNGATRVNGVPTPEQMREQIEDFVRDGAIGLISFCMCDGSARMEGLAVQPELQEAVAKVHDEIRQTGSLTVRPQPDWMRESRVQPIGQWETPDRIPGIVPRWYVLGPFDDGSVPEVPSAGADGEDGEAVYDGKYGPVRWTNYRTHGGVIGLGEIHGGQVPAVTTFASAAVISPREQEVRIFIGTDNDGQLMLNGSEIYSYSGERGINRDDDTVSVVLPQGRSDMLLRVHNRTGLSGFFVRFADPDGMPLEGLTFMPDGQ